MMPLHRGRDAFVLQWLGLATLVILLAATAVYLLFREHERVTRTEHERLVTMTGMLEVSIERNLVSVNSVLLELRNELRSGLPGRNFNERVSTLAKAMPSVRTLTIHDSTGRIIAANRGELVGRNDHFSERAYLAGPKNSPDPERLFVSPPFRTVLDVFTITVSRRISDANGQFSGVVTATLDPTYFVPLLDSVRYAADMSAALQHEDGVVFLGVPPEREAIVGRNLAVPGSFFLRHKESGQPVTVFTGRLLATGEERIIVQRNVRPAELKMDKALGVAITRRVDAVYAPWHHSVLEVATLLALTALLLAGGLYAYQRRHSEFLEREAESRRALAESESRLKTIIETVPECVKVLRPDGTLAQMNPAGLAILEADSEKQVLGRTLDQFVAAPYRQAFNELAVRVSRGESGRLEFESTGLKGGRRWLETHALPLRDSAGDIKGLLAVTRDITERKHTERELERLARTDSLTGLHNRHYFMELAEQEIARTLRYGGPLSAFMIDIDHFKQINDDHGHHAGDRVLERFGQCLRETLRDVDYAGRIGGEEFAVLLPHTDGARAMEAAERVRDSIAKASADTSGMIPITVSIGVATLAPGENTTDSLLRRADAALYQAKHAGRNRVCKWTAAALHPEV